MTNHFQHHWTSEYGIHPLDLEFDDLIYDRVDVMITSSAPELYDR